MMGARKMPGAVVAATSRPIEVVGTFRSRTMSGVTGPTRTVPTMAVSVMLEMSPIEGFGATSAGPDAGREGGPEERSGNVRTSPNECRLGAPRARCRQPTAAAPPRQDAVLGGRHPRNLEAY